MLTLLIALVFLAIVAFIARAVLTGLGAPVWSLTVLTGIVLLVALIMVANAFGYATPSLK